MNVRATRTAGLAGALAMLVGSVLAASQGPAIQTVPAAPSPAQNASRPAEPPRLETAVRTTSIVGTAWRADDTPIPLAKLRLRNVVSGQIRAHTVADELGQFAFREVESGSYLVELVSDTGKVLTVGQTFSVARGETIATFVRLGTRDPWFKGFFSNAAAAIASTAAAAGVTAIAPEQMTCASPPCGGEQ